jgi:HSP20 family protein
VPDAGAEAFFDDARRQIDRMREEFWTNKDNLRELLRSPGARMPALDDTKVEETPTEYHVTLELSGFAKDEVQLHLRGDRMTVVCEQRKSREGEAGDGSSREMFYNRLERVVPFAVAVDHTKIKSTFSDGVLRVTLFKAPR